MGYRNIGPEDGWSKPVYVDDWGNIVSEKEVEKERQRKELQSFLADTISSAMRLEEPKPILGKPGIGVRYESKELQERCEAEMAKVKARKPKKVKQVREEPKERIDSDFPYWQGVNLIIQTYLQRNGLIVVKKEKYESLCKERSQLLHEKSVREESERRYGK